MDDHLRYLVELFGKGRSEFVYVRYKLGCHVQQFDEASISQVVRLIEKKAERGLTVKVVHVLQTVDVL